MSAKLPRGSASQDIGDRVSKESLISDLTKERRRREEAEQKLQIAEATVAAQRKELLVLQRQLGAPASDTPARRKPSTPSGAPDVPHAGALAEPLTREMQALEDKVHRLQAENSDLINYAKKQNRLIEILKRQKMLLEAGTLLTISEREFDKYLELEKF